MGREAVRSPAFRRFFAMFLVSGPPKGGTTNHFASGLERPPAVTRLGIESVFRIQMNMTPTEYRERHQTKDD